MPDTFTSRCGYTWWVPFPGSQGRQHLCAKVSPTDCRYELGSKKYKELNKTFTVTEKKNFTYFKCILQRGNKEQLSAAKTWRVRFSFRLRYPYLSRMCWHVNKTSDATMYYLDQLCYGKKEHCMTHSQQSPGGEGGMGRRKEKKENI